MTSTQMKGHTTLLVLRKVQIKTEMRILHIQQNGKKGQNGPSVSKHVDKYSYMLVNGCSQLETVRQPVL